MPELSLDDDGFLDMAMLDDGVELTGADTERADAALRRAFDADLSATWRAALDDASVGDDVVYLEARVVPVEHLDSHRRRGFPALLAAAAGLVLIVGAVGLGLGWFSDDEPITRTGGTQTATATAAPEPTPTPTPQDEPDPVPSSTAIGPALERIVVVGDAPRKPVEAAGSLWVSNRDGETVTRIDPATGDRFEIAVDAGPDTALTAAGALWVPAREGGVLTKIDLDSLEVTQTAVGADPDTPTLAAGHIWVALRGDRQIAVVDPDTAQVVQRIPLNGRPLTPVLVDDDLWFVTRDDNRLHRIALGEWGPETLPELTSVDVGADPDRPLAADGRLWVPARAAARIDVVDPASAQLLASVSVGETPDTPVAAGGRIWVPDAGQSTVTVIDSATLEVVSAVVVGPTPRTGVAEGGVVWIPVAGEGVVVGIDAGTTEILHRIEVGVAPDTPAVVGDSLWVPDAGGSTVVEIRLR